MPFFSPAHQDELINAFWHHGEVRCPHDGKALDSRFHPQHTTYLLVLACNHCGRKAQVTRFSDPQCYLFRPWTPSDIAVLSAAYSNDVPAKCPVCQARVRCREICPDSDISLDCPRCGNIHLLSFGVTPQEVYALNA